MSIIFFLERDISGQDLEGIEAEIRQSPLVSELQFVGADEALKRFRTSFPELEGIIANLKTNPFPPSFEAALHERSAMSGEVTEFIRRMSGMKGIEDVQFNRDWVEKIQSFSRLARAVGFFLGSILILASFFIISNVIKLNVLARKGEIEILRLVGATNTFIRIPFLLEGTILGILGSLVSLGLLSLLINLFPFYLGSSLGALQELVNLRYLSTLQRLTLVGGGGITGLLGSLSSISRFLKT